MRFVSKQLRGSDVSLTDRYDVALLDLDGVVYIGADAVSGVPQALSSARAAGMQLAFVTNNASRTPADVAEHLVELGIAARPEEVITSSQAAARYLADELGADAVVLVVGTEALAGALRERGLRPFLAGTEDAVRHDTVAVVQGYSPATNWRMLADAAVVLNRGALWVATNADPTVPSPRGPLPGNGSLVQALRHATGAEPVVTGKPDPTMHRETVIRTGARHPIVVGDRLDTDIEGANAVGCASLLVLSGVTSPRELLAAPPALRPDFLALDASGLLARHPAPAVTGTSSRCGSWQVRTTDAGWQLTACVDGVGRDSAGRDTVDALRALCAVAWTAAAPQRAYAASDDQTAASALEALELTG
jgi:HAD superfamily hydrolase (TIGR01450 family)